MRELDMLVPTLLYALIIVIGLATYIAIGLSHS